MATRLLLADLGDQSKVSSPASAAGVCSVAFGPVDPGYVWRVGLINVQSNSVATPKALVYVGDVLPQHLRSGTNAGTLDTADQAWPIVVPAGLSLQIEWTGADPNSLGLAGIQYEVYQRITGADGVPKGLWG